MSKSILAPLRPIYQTTRHSSGKRATVWPRSSSRLDLELHLFSRFSSEGVILLTTTNWLP